MPFGACPSSDKKIKLTDLNHERQCSRALEALFLEIRDTIKGTFGEKYEPATLTACRKGLRRYFLERREGKNFDISVGDGANLNKKLLSKAKASQSV